MYKALNYWVYGGFTGEKTAYEFIDFAVANKLDGVELTVGDCLKADITEDECRRIAAYAAEKKIGIRTLASGFFWGCSLGADDVEERPARRGAAHPADRHPPCGGRAAAGHASAGD